MRLLFAMVAALVVMAAPVQARYVQTVKVRYQANFTNSQWYTIDVTFVTGTELNQATRTFSYTSYKNYAVVFWAEGEATVIQLDGYFVCGFSFEATCMPLVGKMKGQDQQGRLWEVCTGQFCY
jgi:hypothetical protein